MANGFACSTKTPETKKTGRRRPDGRCVDCQGHATATRRSPETLPRLWSCLHHQWDRGYWRLEVAFSLSAEDVAAPDVEAQGAPRVLIAMVGITWSFSDVDLTQVFDCVEFFAGDMEVTWTSRERAMYVKVLLLVRKIFQLFGVMVLLRSQSAGGRLVMTPYRTTFASQRTWISLLHKGCLESSRL